MKRSVVIGLVVILGVFFQMSFILVESVETPQKVLIQFCKAFYNLDKSAASYVTEQARVQDDVDLLAQYRYRMKKMARERGYRDSFAESWLYGIKTKIIEASPTDAEINITGKRTFPIRWLMTQEVHNVDHTFKLVKENNRWKISEGIATLQ